MTNTIIDGEILGLWAYVLDSERSGVPMKCRVRTKGITYEKKIVF